MRLRSIIAILFIKSFIDNSLKTRTDFYENYIPSIPNRHIVSYQDYSEFPYTKDTVYTLDYFNSLGDCRTELNIYKISGENSYPILRSTNIFECHNSNNTSVLVSKITILNIGTFLMSAFLFNYFCDCIN